MTPIKLNVLPGLDCLSRTSFVDVKNIQAELIIHFSLIVMDVLFLI